MIYLFAKFDELTVDETDDSHYNLVIKNINALKC